MAGIVPTGGGSLYGHLVPKTDESHRALADAIRRAVTNAASAQELEEWIASQPITGRRRAKSDLEFLAAKMELNAANFRTDADTFTDGGKVGAALAIPPTAALVLGTSAVGWPLFVGAGVGYGLFVLAMLLHRQARRSENLEKHTAEMCRKMAKNIDVGRDEVGGE